ncbi:DUF499 domain-containing protein [Vulgatibacter incomptus]|nr:DUF499 domain-containing protein [Vulgatibacter incomptus]
MSLSTLCKPRASVFERDRRATVLNLDTFLDGRVSGEEFFRENYFTAGMDTLVQTCFRHLSGRSGSSTFLLSQAMGGGKTHSMIGLGLLARDPALRRSVLGDADPAPNLGKVRVIGFQGRNTGTDFGIWGALADQIGRRDHFHRFYAPLSAPSPGGWKELLKDQPTIILLDELPPYMVHARSVSIGASDLSAVTAVALSNLLVAVSDLDNVCVIISDLGGTAWGEGGTAITGSIKSFERETNRIAVNITPVNPQGDELYHILRCRLFDGVPAKEDVERVARTYRDAHAEAVKMGLTTTQSESLYQQILDSYPFHPAWRDLVGRFKENEGFQQTRGVIRLMQMLIGNLWTTGQADRSDLVHPYDLDLANDEIAGEVRTINQHLTPAIANDISDRGHAEAEEIDKKTGTTDGTDAARLLLVASLSTIPNALHGLREFELYDILQRPGRDLSSFKSAVLDVLETRAWYLHRSPDQRLFFKNQQNLAAKLRTYAQALHKEIVLKELRTFLEKRFEPQLKDAYQSLAVLPAMDEVELDQDRVVLILTEPRGGEGGLALSSEWQAWWQNQTFKNRVVFLTGSRLVMQNVNDCARQYRALQSIEDELRTDSTPPNDPQWKVLDGLRDRIGNQLGSALTQAFDTLIYPSINEKLRPQGISFEFRGNSLSGEDAVRKALKEAQKLETDTTSDTFRARAEARLFTAKSMLWSEVRRKAATSTNWPFHSAKALEDLKVDTVKKGHWRDQANYVEKGPFPKAKTSVAIEVLGRNDETGVTWLRIDPLHGDTVYFEKGDSIPTTASPKVDDFQRFEASGLRYRFICVDSRGEHPDGDPVDWKGRIVVRYQIDQANGRVKLQAIPKGQIRYSTDGGSPENGATYEGPFVPPDSCRMVLAVAEAQGIKSEPLQVSMPRRHEDGRPKFEVKANAPCRWKKRHRLDATADVWAWLEKLEKHDGTARHLTINAQSEDGGQTLRFQGTHEDGYPAAALRVLFEQVQSVVGGHSLRLDVLAVNFAAGQNLLDWIASDRAELQPNEVEQVYAHV